MKKSLGNLAAILKHVGVFALCFVMLAVMTGMAGALADDIDMRAEAANRDDNIATFGTITYKNLPTDGNLNQGDTFTMAIFVTEEDRTTYFDLDQMYLNLPEGLTYEITKPGDEPHILNIAIYVHQTGEKKILKGEVEIDEKTNKLLVTWDKTSDGYGLLAQVTNANYRVELAATVDGSSDVIDLGTDGRFYVHNTAQATFTKSFGPDGADNVVKALYDANAVDAPKFTTTVTVAKTGTAGEGEFVDDNQIVRSEATGKIVYVEQEVTFSLADMTYDASKQNYYYVLPNLQPNKDAGITVTETQPLDLSGKGYTYNANNQTTASIPALAPFSSQTCSLINTYTQDTGSLTLNKSFFANTPAINAVNISNAQKQSIQITVSGTTLNGDTYSKTVTYDQMTNGSYTIDNIPAGSYTITETAMIDGYRWVVAMYRVDGVGGMTTADGAVDIIRNGVEYKEYVNSTEMGFVSIGKGETHTAELQNGYIQKLGNLNLSKNFDGSLTDNQKNQVQFQITTTVNDQPKYVWFTASGVGTYKFDRLEDYPADSRVYYSTFNYGIFAESADRLSFENLPEGDYTITESNADFSGYDRETTYTIGGGAAQTPKSENTNPYFSVHVSDGRTTAAAVNNRYTEKGSLTVSKQVSGATLTDAQKQAITFKLQRKAADGTWVPYDNKTVYYSAMRNGMYTWNNLPYGEYRVVETAGTVDNYTRTTTYTVKENVAGGSTTTANGSGMTAEVDVINPYAGSTDSVKTVSAAQVTFTNAYQPITTDMTISKHFSGNYPLPTHKAELEKQITFQVMDGTTTLTWVKQTDGSYKLGSGTDSVTDIPYSALGSDGTVRLTGLPVGKEYTIIEMNSTLDGYNRITYVNNSTKPAESNSDPFGQVTLRENHTASTTFTNSYVPVATLKVEKSFTGVLPNDYCNEYILPELKFVISTVIDDETWYVTDVNGKMSKSEADAMKFPYNTIATGVSLQGDRTYTVTESGHKVTGYAVYTWNTVDSKLTTGTSGNVYVAPNGTGLIKFTNRYLQGDDFIIPVNAGAVESHKTWTGLDNGPSTGDEGIAVQNAVRFEIHRKINGAWSLYDTYTLGELTSGKITYSVVDEYGNKRDYTAPILLPVGSYKLIEKDAEYPGYIHKATVSILNKNGEGPGSNDTVDVEMTSNGVEFTVGSGDTVTFSIANVYYPLGKLTVTKTIDQAGDLTSLTTDQRANVGFALYSSVTPNTPIAVFNLNGVQGNQNPYNINVTSASNNGKFTITIENLPIGYFREIGKNDWELVRYQYTVKESNAVTNYDCTATVTIDKSKTAGSTNAADNSGTVVLFKLSREESGDVAAMTFSNKYTRQNGSLKVTKVFEHADNLTAAQKNRVTFQIFTSTEKVVSWNNVNGQHVYSANGTVNKFTYGDMTNGEYIVSGLPTGGYYVVETNANVEPYPYLRTTSFIVTNGIGVTTDEITTTTEGKSDRDQSPNVTVSNGANSTVVVKNIYHATGSLTLTKTFAFEGNAQMSEDLRKSIFFTLKQGNTVIASGSLASEGVAYDAATNSYSYTFYNLPVGDYTIIESNADPSGYVRTTTVVVDGKTTVSAKTARDGIDTSDNGTPSASFKIDHGEPQEVQFTNSYAEYGTLTITKAFTGLDNEAFSAKSNWDPKKVIFAVRNANDPTNTILPDSNDNRIVDENGNPIGTVTYDQLSDSAILTLPAGTYTVEEIILDESNKIVDTKSLFYGYIHNNTQYTITTANVTGSTKTTGQGADGEVGNVETEGFRVGAGNATVAFTNNYTKVDLLEVVKDCDADPVSSTKLPNGTDLPVWEFNVTITNLSDLNTVNGETTLIDTYDIPIGEGDAANQAWFKLYTAPGFEPKITSTNGGMVKSYKDNGDGTAEFVISVRDANGKAAGESITLTYYLQVKDQNAFADLTASQGSISNPSENEAGYGTAKWTFRNSVQYWPRPMDDPKYAWDDYYYGMAPIRKTIASEDGSPIVKFTLDINPEAIHIGTGENLTIYDKMSDNVQVDMLSFTFEPSDIRVTTDRYNGSDWDLVITVPNDTHVKITYTGTIMETGNAVGVSNQANLNGVNAIVHDNVNVNGDSDGTASLVQIKLFKHGAGNYSERLQGAVFTLYAADDINFENPLGSYTTDEDGIATISILESGVGIDENTPYVLKETVPPIGYALNTAPISFIITTDVSEANPELGIYHFTTPIEFSNTPLSTQVAFTATKELTGSTLEADQFTFGLYNSSGYRMQTATNDATGTVTFSEITYTYSDVRAQQSEDGTATFTYYIKEEVPTPAAPGYTYDTNEYQVTVTLSLNEDGTELLADVAYPTEAGLTITNTYKAEGSFTLEGTKTVTNATVVREAFEFEIWDDAYLCSAWNSTGVEGDKAPINYPTFQYVLDPDATEGVIYDRGNHTVIITTNELSSFQFSIREKPSLNSSYDCDENRYTLTVTAVDNGDGTLQVNGALKLNGTDAGDTADFTNMLLGSLTIRKNVTVGGKPAINSLADGQYGFGIFSDPDGNNMVTNAFLEITNGESNTVTVNGLAPGTYYIEEGYSTNPNVSLVGEQFRAVTITNDVTVVPTVTFTNNRASGHLSLTKTTAGKTTDGVFMFNITVEGVAEGQTFNAESSLSGPFPAAFGVTSALYIGVHAGETITIYDLPVGAEYTIAELTHDDHLHGFIVGTGSGLTGVIEEGKTAVAVQNNVYKAHGEATISGAKSITNADHIRDSYKFEIKDAEGNVVYTAQTPAGVESVEVSIPYPWFKYVVDPTATAGTTYDEANRLITVTVNSTADLKAAVYTISEKADPDNASCRYDNSVYTMTVTPTDLGNGGVFVSISLTKNGNSVRAANFTNEYLGSLIIRKNVTVGGQATNTNLADGTYTFQVLKTNGSVVAKPTITITNGASNTAVVTGLVPGLYLVHEDGGDNPNVELVSHRQVAVTVLADNDAELPEAPIGAFTNNRPVGNLKLVKVLSGTDDPDAAFEFTVTIAEAAGQTYQTKTSTGDRSEVTFDSEYGIATITVTAGNPVSILDLPYGAAYTVAEVDVEGDGYTPGTITGATGTITKNATVTVTQTNVYAAEAIISLSGTKTVTGATIIREPFTFQIKDGDNEPWTVTTPVTGDSGNMVAIPYPSIKYVTSPSAQNSTTYDAANNMIIVSANSADELPQKTFTITEVTGTNTAYTYDASVYTLTTRATDNGDGTLSVGYSVKKNGEDAASNLNFTNTYTGSLEIKKNVTVGDEATETDLADGTYLFEVYSDVECTNKVAECSITIEGGQSNTATVSGLAPGTYYVKEIDSDNENVTLLTKAVSVTVSGDATADVNTAEFTNDRGVGSLKLEKTVTGTEADDKEFTFVVTVEEVAGLTYAAQHSGNDERTEVTFDEDGKITVILKANETFTITNLPNGAAYTVEETELPDGYTSTDGDTNEGAIEADTTVTVTHDNTYTAEGTATIDGIKTATGATVIHESFVFEIKEGEDTVYTIVTDTGVEGDTVDISYPIFEYVVDPTATAGTVYDQENSVITVTVNKVEDLAEKEYTISEKAGENDAYTYDDSVYTLTVTPEDKDNGTVTVTLVLTKGDDPADQADFTNTYTGSLEIKKNVTVGDEAIETDLADGTYLFEVYSDVECTNKVAECSITIEGGQSNTATVSGLVPGTYYVKEIDSDNENVTLLEEAVSVIVSGDAEADVIPAEFTNNRGVGSLTLEKTVTGTEADDKEFTFVVTVEEVAGLTYAAQHSGDEEMTEITFDEDGTATVILKANETFTIKDLPHGAAYTVEETELPDGYTSTDGDMHEGVIEADTTVTVTHDNTYAAEGTADLQVDKQVEGYEGDGVFTFILSDAEGTEIDSVQCGANETAVFETLTYTQPDTYHYTITEVTPELEDRVPGMEYNSNTYYATVVVTDNGDGTLSTAVTYGEAEDDTAEDSLTITNVYNKPEGTAILSVTKALTGNTDAYTADELFVFELAICDHELTSATNNVLVPIGEEETEPDATAAAKVGEIATWTLKYDEPGTYTYTITEAEGTTPGMTYDTTAHAVTVIVEYADDLMSLQATVIYEAETDNPGAEDPDAAVPEDPDAEDPDAEDPDAEDPDAEDPDADESEEEDTVEILVITNKYGETSYRPGIKKIVDGRGAPDETFTFTLTDEEGNTQTASCKADETAWFSEIVYHEPGTYVYTVTENTPDRKTAGMTYSKKTVTITVTVVSAEDGTLEATAEYTDDGTITNQFTPPPTYDYKFSFTKKWSGGVEGSIEWTLYNPDGTVAHKKFNKKVLSETEWYYEGWFSSNKDYYIIEDVPEGYTAIYINVGEHADVTDRLYNGGTIINRRVPKTGDAFNPLSALATFVTSSALLAALIIRNNKRKRTM